MTDVEKKSYEEKKRERFVKVAELRTNNIIKTIRLLGNCSNRSNYGYTNEDVRKIFSAIDNELKAAKARFSEVEPEKDKEFKL